MNLKKKFEEIEFWAKLQKNPTTAEIYSQFDYDLESVVIAHLYLGREIKKDLQVFCSGMSLVEKIERYSGFAELFKTFVPQDLKTAIEIYKINKDADGFGKLIINESSDEAGYVGNVGELEIFPNKRIELTIKGVTLDPNNTKDADFLDDKISNKSELEFKDSTLKDIYFFLSLEDHAEVSVSFTKELKIVCASLKFIKTYEIAAIGQICKDYIEYRSEYSVIEMFDQKAYPVTLSMDEHTKYKKLKTDLKDKAQDLVSENIAELLAVATGGSSILIGLCISLLKKAKQMNEDQTVHFTEEDEKKLYNNFLKEENLTLREFILREVSFPIKSTLTQAGIPLQNITTDLFATAYEEFFNFRCKPFVDMLSPEEIKQAEQSSDQDKRDTIFYQLISKRKLNLERVSGLIL